MTRPTPGSALRIVVLTAIALSLLAPAAATAARSEFYGIVQGPSLDDKDVQGVRNAHIRTNRYLLAWESVQPDNKNTFSWGLTDKFIGRLAAQGIRTVPAVWGNPSWVSGYQARPPLDSAADITAWRNFLKAARSIFSSSAAASTAPGSPEMRRAAAFRSSSRSGTIWQAARRRPPRSSSMVGCVISSITSSASSARRSPSARR